MTISNTTEATRAKNWAGAIASPALEFPLTPLRAIAGKIPPGLRGSLYRNGPAQLTRGNTRVGHWFDGDGAVLAVHFTGKETTATYRYVLTSGYQSEEKANKFLFGGYGMMAPGPIWERFRKGVKNVANTSVLALPDKLLALWEGGHPHALDLKTLETFGLDDLGTLENNWPFSAHPKRDPKTGEIYNFGLTPGKISQLHIYRSSRTGKILQHTTFPIEGIPMVHDFVMAGRYLIFLIPPVRMQLLPALFQLKSFSDALAWRKELGTQILVIDRATLEIVSRGEAEPWYQWHFGNGYEDPSGDVMLDLVRYEDFQTNQYLKEVATGHTETAAKGTLWQLRLAPTTGKLIHAEKVVDLQCEFPTIDSRKVGQEARFTYISIHRKGVDARRELFGEIARYDHHTGILTETDLGEHRYPSEPIYVPDADRPGQGWAICVVYDANEHQSEVWIFDAERLDAPPTCRLALPSVVPFGFHGTWQPGN